METSMEYHFIVVARFIKEKKKITQLIITRKHSQRKHTFQRKLKLKLSWEIWNEKIEEAKRNILAWIFVIASTTEQFGLDLKDTL